MKHQQYTAPELITIHLDEAACTLLSASSVKQINKENDVNIIGSTEEDDAHNACSKGFMFWDEDDFDDWE
ncbi:hypothetical protein [Hoylesella timonensis]|uniref:Uncharacterized protein n=1 Tax=Hoylesella timonensis TaxID=386414 RepID=A0A2N6Q5T5_9BACT|nr:hypothetical protein [Hoylesella timonensis]PMC10338.1 hypothetical protein CJ232_05810 [Hoylesella timonensis]